MTDAPELEPIPVAAPNRSVPRRLEAMVWNRDRRLAMSLLLLVMIVNACSVYVIVLFYVLGRIMEYADPTPTSIPFLNVCWFFLFTTPIVLIASLVGSWASFFAAKYKLALSIAPVPLINVAGSYTFLAVADRINGVTASLF